MRTGLILTSCAALLVFAGCETSPAPSRQPVTALSDHRPVPILRNEPLNDPGLTQLGVMLINSRAELEQRAPQAQALAEMEVDFAAESLLVLCLGERPTGGYWVRITGVQHDAAANALYVQGVANEPGPEAMVTQALTYPCDAAVIPKVRAAAVHPEIDSRTDMPLP